MASKEIVKSGIWGTKAKGSVRNEWSFQLEKDHRLAKITIDHGDGIYSLTFTTEDSTGRLHTSKKVGGWNGGSTVLEVIFYRGEEIIGVNGTAGVSNSIHAYKIITSLSFVTNKKRHGPVGIENGTFFSIPWDKGSFAGFYGLAGRHIFGIGVYMDTSRGAKPSGPANNQVTPPSVQPGPNHNNNLQSTDQKVVNSNHVTNPVTPPSVQPGDDGNKNMNSSNQSHQEISRLRIWGRQTGGPQNNWSFRLEKNHKLKMITIDHGNLIYSLTFTSEDSMGYWNTSNKAGGWNGGDKVSQVTFGSSEELVGITGTVGVSTGTYAGYTIISSLSFQTNQTTYGPFGLVKGTFFSENWQRGLFAGFYGLAGYYLDGIGVYVNSSGGAKPSYPTNNQVTPQSVQPGAKSHQEISRLRIWGKQTGGPQNNWSFRLEKNHKLKMITVDHGNLINSLMFTTEDSMGYMNISNKVGGWNGGDKVSQVTFGSSEELVGITGTVGVSTGTYAGYTIISSLSFQTTQTTYGPFGLVKGTFFSEHWQRGVFAGFYGLAGYYLDGIGVYVKVTR